MAIFGSPFGLNQRRRQLAEQALAGDDQPVGVTPINPDAPPPVRLPDIPTGPAPRSRPRIPSVPGEMPGAPPSSPLPETAMPSAMPLPARGAPGGMPAPSPPPPNLEPPSRYTRLQAEKEGYMRGTPGRLKSGFKGALSAAGQGGEGGLGGLVGRLVGGFAGGAINPRGLREMEFNQRVRPEIMERFAYEDADVAARSAAEKALREDQAARVNIANINSQIQSRQAADALNQDKFAFEQDQPFNVPEGVTAINRRTGKPVFTSPRRPSASEEEDAIAASLIDEQGTVESQSQGSLQGRLESLKGRLTPEEQRLAFGGATSSDDPQAIARAQAKWQKIQDDELNSIRRDTGERRKAAVSRKRFGRKGQAQGGTGITRSRSEFNSSKFPGMRFD